MATRYNDGVAILIRQFERGDFDTLWGIDQACFDPQLAYSREELAFYMRRPGAFTLVAEDDHEGQKAAHPVVEIVGFIVAETRRKVGHIITIDVIEAARRGRIGSTLLDAAEDRIKKAGAMVVELETPVDNEAAIRFYRKKGYAVEKVAPGYYSGELDALVMTKELASAISSPARKKEVRA